MNVSKFCKLLSSNDIKESKQEFLKLPQDVQKTFLDCAWEIFSHKSKYPKESYLTSFRVFRLFGGKTGTDNPLYEKYSTKPLFKTLYSNASKKKVDSDSYEDESTVVQTRKKTVSKPPSRSPRRSSRRSRSSPRTSKKYQKEYQKYQEPESETDPLYIYYTTLRQQRPDSRLALVWLMEHGVYEGDERDELVKQYKKMK
jgi:hypothetical protein